MHTHIKSILIVLVTLALGIFIGKLVWQSENSGAPVHNHTEDAATSAPVTTEYTCSMHPQIRQNEPGICPICEMDLVPVDDSSTSDDPLVLQMTENAVKLAQVETFIAGVTTANQRAGEMPVRVEGTLELDERLTNTQTSHIDGRIEKLYVNFTGEYVKKGQLVARVYSPEVLSASKELITAAKNEDRFPGLKRTAIEKLKNWKLAESTIDRILESGSPVANVDIYADHSGYVTRKMVSNGDYVMDGGAMYVLSATNQLWAIFNVFEKDMAGISKGQSIEFTTDAIPGRTFKASVSYIDPIVDPQTRSIPVRATIANSGGVLKPGMLIKGRILKRSQAGSSGILVPKTAVLWTGPRSVVYLQIPDQEVPTYSYREVELGETVGEYYKVISGIEPGDQVVTQGAFAIDASAQLSNKKSMINKDVSIKSADQNSSPTPDFRENTPSEFSKQLKDLVDAYLVIKDDLVLTDATATASAIQPLQDALAGIDMSLVTGAAHEFWMQQYYALKAHSTKMQNSTDVEFQRKQFEFLSDALIASVQAYGLEGDTLYVQYCPMAFDNKGADWLSKDDFIRNPYFGDKMLKCGMVTDTLR